MIKSTKPLLKSMNRGMPIFFKDTQQVYCPVFKCGYTSSHKAYCPIGKVLASFNDLIDYEDAEKVTMVRNPYDRVVSLWTSENNRDHLHETSNSFESFVDNIEELLAAGYIDGHYNTIVQNLSIKGKFVPDKVFKLEEKDELLEHLPKSPDPFPKANASVSRQADYQSYYTSVAVIETVSRIYREDIERFGYSFD